MTIGLCRVCPAGWSAKEQLIPQAVTGLHFIFSPLLDWMQFTYFLKDDLLYLKLVLIFIQSLLKVPPLQPLD